MDLAPTDLQALSAFERFALHAARFVNETPALKAISHHGNMIASRPWMTLVSRSRVRLVGLEHVVALRPDRGVLLAANHRSFFDMYMVTTYLSRHVDYCRRLYFPVRSGFYYDNPLGLFVNLAASGMSMYPPVFRLPSKRAVTRAGLDRVAELLKRPGTIVGIHPEGTRAKGDDPYELLPPEQGFGRVVLRSNPIVIPVFINGMGNNLVRETIGTATGTGAPIIIVFGAPLDLSAFAHSDPNRLRGQLDVGRHVLGEIAKLGEQDRALRAAG